MSDINDNPRQSWPFGWALHWTCRRGKTPSGLLRLVTIHSKYTNVFNALLTTIHTILAVVVAKQWELHQMNVHNVFLNGDNQLDVGF